MRIFGVDPGSRVTGYGVISAEGSRLRCLDYGKIEALAARGDNSLAVRLRRIHEALVQLIERHAPDAMAVEEVFHAVNVQSALKLGHARGVVLLAAAEAGIPVLEYSALAVKKSVVGYGRAEKSQVQMMVKTLLRLSQIPQPHDAADALAVAICHNLNSTPLQSRRIR